MYITLLNAIVIFYAHDMEMSFVNHKSSAFIVDKQLLNFVGLEREHFSKYFISIHAINFIVYDIPQVCCKTT